MTQHTRPNNPSTIPASDPDLPPHFPPTPNDVRHLTLTCGGWVGPCWAAVRCKFATHRLAHCLSGTTLQLEGALARSHQPSTGVAVAAVVCSWRTCCEYDTSCTGAGLHTPAHHRYVHRHILGTTPVPPHAPHLPPPQRQTRPLSADRWPWRGGARHGSLCAA